MSDSTRQRQELFPRRRQGTRSSSRPPECKLGARLEFLVRIHPQLISPEDACLNMADHGSNTRQVSFFLLLIPGLRRPRNDRFRETRAQSTKLPSVAFRERATPRPLARTYKNHRVLLPRYSSKSGLIHKHIVKHIGRYTVSTVWVFPSSMARGLPQGGSVKLMT